MSDDRRERAIDEQVRAALSAPRAAGVCPDAETLALYASQSLANEERAIVEPHLSQCVRCQDVLAVLATTDDLVPSEGAAPLGAPQRDVREDGPAPAAAAPTSWWRWRWLLPVPAAALAAALYFVVRPTPPVATPDFEMAARDAGAGSGTVAGTPGKPADADQPLIAGPRPTPSGNGAGGRANTAPGTPVADAERRAKLAVTDESSAKATVAEARRDSASVPATVRPEPVAAQSTSMATITDKAAAGTEQSGVVAGTVRDARSSIPAEFAMGRTASAAPSTLWLPSPDEARFRIDASGRLASSADLGRTWQPVDLPQPAVLTTGHCATPTTPGAPGPCWLAGRHGVVFRTLDGATWHRVPSPTAHDIVTITSSAGDRAVLMTADGLRFETTDAGATWRER